MDQLPVSIATEEDEEKAGPIDQAPPDWTEGIDWTIPKSKATQKKFNKILYSKKLWKIDTQKQFQDL